MKKIFRNSLALALSINLVAMLNLQAEVISLEEDGQDGVCPSKEISYLNNLSTHTLMEGEGAIDESWDSDKYSFAPNAEGTIKITYSSEERLNVKIDYICDGSGIYRLAGSSSVISGSTEFRVLADQEVHIGLWDWDNGPYLYDLNIEFTPDDDQGGGGDNNDTIPIPITQTIYEDAQNQNTAGWENLRAYPGSITNILIQDTHAIKLTGPNADSYRASYRLKMDDGSNWANSEQFVAKWEIKTADSYELFFYAKSDDDTNILNYIGYVSELPELEGYSFDITTGYWSIDGSILHDWGRYVYNIIDENTSAQLTSFTKDLKASALNTLGINLTSIEYLHVNVIGIEESNIILDNILLQTEINSSTPTNNPPIAIAQNVIVDENVSTTITLAATDDDNDTLTFAISSDVSNGTLSGDAPNLTYLPNAGFVGNDSFTFTASDANASSTATIDITVEAVTPTNNPPIAIEQNITVDKNSSVDFTLTATDADNDTLTFAISSDVSNGTLSGDAPNLTYTPNIDFVGDDSFTFSVSDANESSTQSINITVNDVQNIVEITEDEALSEHFLGMNIDLDASKIVIRGEITPNWDMDRYSFNSGSLSEIKITLTNGTGENMEFYVIKNYSELLTKNSSGNYNLDGSFSLITVMIIAENSTDVNEEYTLTIEK